MCYENCDWIIEDKYTTHNDETCITRDTGTETQLIIALLHVAALHDGRVNSQLLTARGGTGGADGGPECGHGAVGSLLLIHHDSCRQTWLQVKHLLPHGDLRSLYPLSLQSTGSVAGRTSACVCVGDT